MILASFGHLTDHRQSHRLPSYFVRTVFPFATKEKNLKNRLPAKKAQNACRAVVGGPAGEFPAIFFRSLKFQKKSRALKTKKKQRVTD